MGPVQIICGGQGSIVLRARSSELLILPQYVRDLKKLENPKEFSEYFLGNALVNRPARKLFTAWLRKDATVWPRLYKTVHEQIKDEDFEDQSSDDMEKESKDHQSIATKEEKTVVK